MTNDISIPLSEADVEIKLAVDLIYLLEANQIQPEIALKALKLVKKDLLNKIKEAEH
jgi:Protein of unknown function (DUF2496).